MLHIGTATDATFGPKPKRKVRFSDANKVHRIASPSEQDLVANVHYIHEVIRTLLRAEIGEVLYVQATDMDPEDAPNDERLSIPLLRARNSIDRMLDELGFGEADIKDAVWFRLLDAVDSGETVAELVRAATAEFPISGYRSPTVKLAAVILRLELRPFFIFNHCRNECFTMIRPAQPSDTSIRFISAKGAKPALIRACADTIRDIEDFLGSASQMRWFDTLLRFASQRKCSLLQHQGP